MKQQDIALVIAIVFVSGIFSFVISTKLINPPEKTLEAAKVEPISTEFNEPSPDYFNEKSINPTQVIRIDDSKNENPFR